MRGPVWLVTRRSIAAPMSAVALVAGLWLLFSRSAWQCNTLAAIDWASGAIVLQLPLHVGAAAFDGWRLWRGSMRSLLAPGMRSRRGLFALAGVHAVAALTSWLTTVAAAYAIALVRGADPQFDVYMLVHPAALLIAGATCGVALGAAISRPWVSPVLALSVFSITVAAENTPTFQRFFMAGGHTAWSPTLRYIPSLAVEKAVIWSLVATAGALLAVSLESAIGGSRLLVRGASGVAIGAGVLMVTVAMGQPVDTSGLTSRAPVVECFGASPEICVDTEEQILADSFAGPLGDAYAFLAPYGVTPPDRILDLRLAAKPDLGSGGASISPDVFGAGYPSREQLLQTISEPALCPGYFGDGSDPILSVRSAVHEWANLTLPGAADASTWEDVYPGLPKADVDAWIAEAYQALKSCDASSLPTPGGGA